MHLHYALRGSMESTLPLRTDRLQLNFVNLAISISADPEPYRERDHANKGIHDRFFSNR